MKRDMEGDEEGSGYGKIMQAGEQKNNKNCLFLSFVFHLYTFCLSLVGTSFFLSISILSWLLDGFRQPINFVPTSVLCLSSCWWSGYQGVRLIIKVYHYNLFNGAITIQY